MAKSPSFFGLRRGSTKSLTFQVLNGRQVTKDRVYDVKNPRTFSQMQQRMVMATAAAAYAGMREIVDHSFEGYTYGQPTMSEFIRLNAKMLRNGLLAGNSYLSFNPFGNRSLYPNPYIISKGTLRDFSNNLNSSIDNGGVIGVAIDGLNIVDGVTTLGDVLSQMGLDKGSFITFVCCAYNTENGYSQFGWCRLIPKEDEISTLVFDLELEQFFEFESNVPVSLSSVFTSELMGMAFDFDQEVDSVSVAVILSKKQLTWQRSNATMIYEFSNDTPSPAAAALATYPVGTDYILNGGTV